MSTINEEPLQSTTPSRCNYLVEMAVQHFTERGFPEEKVFADIDWFTRNGAVHIDQDIFIMGVEVNYRELLFQHETPEAGNWDVCLRDPDCWLIYYARTAPGFRDKFAILHMTQRTHPYVAFSRYDRDGNQRIRVYETPRIFDKMRLTGGPGPDIRG